MLSFCLSFRYTKSLFDNVGEHAVKLYGAAKNIKVKFAFANMLTARLLERKPSTRMVFTYHYFCSFVQRSINTMQAIYLIGIIAW